MDAFVQALNWVNQNTPEKIVNAVKLQSLLLLRDSSPVRLVQ
jgi:hypothetical protein